MIFKRKRGNSKPTKPGKKHPWKTGLMPTANLKGHVNSILELGVKKLKRSHIKIKNINEFKMDKACKGRGVL